MADFSNVLKTRNLCMSIEESRLKTFMNWPFKKAKNVKCTPEMMAKAGFYHVPTASEPDLAMCFACFKELDGWEVNDDPWEEHKAHARKCPFIKRGKDHQLTMRNFFELEYALQTNRLKLASEASSKEFNEMANDVHKELESMFSEKK